MTQADKIYPYEIPKGRTAAALIFCGFLGIFSLYQALTNTKGLLINHLIPLNPGQASVLYGIIGLLMISTLLWSVYAMAVSSGGPKEIHLTAMSLDMPMKGKTLSIPYGRINGMAMETIGRSKRLMIRHPGGKAAISSILFSNPKDFEDCVLEIRSRTPQRYNA